MNIFDEAIQSVRITSTFLDALGDAEVSVTFDELLDSPRFDVLRQAKRRRYLDHIWATIGNPRISRQEATLRRIKNDILTSNWLNLATDETEEDFPFVTLGLGFDISEDDHGRSMFDRARRSGDSRYSNSVIDAQNWTIEDDIDDGILASELW